MAKRRKNGGPGARLLRAWRDHQGLTQAELGGLCGFDGSAIRHYEAGRETGSLRLCVCLARVTGLPLAQLLPPARLAELREACSLLSGVAA